MPTKLDDSVALLSRGSATPPEARERALELMTASLKPEHRGSAADGFVFGEEVSVPDDAPVYDRLAAFAGTRRSPLRMNLRP